MRRTMTAVSGVLLLAGGADAASRGRAPAPPFSPMTIDEAFAAGAAGTGCSFLQGPSRSGAILAMKDDRGAVKRNGRVVRLSPAPGARDLAPFTFDRWQGDSMIISVRQTGRARGAGEASDAPATMSVRMGGRTRTYAGRLNCGS